jgi:hypothetical protein
MGQEAAVLAYRCRLQLPRMAPAVGHQTARFAQPWQLPAAAAKQQ